MKIVVTDYSAVIEAEEKGITVYGTSNSGVYLYYTTYELLPSGNWLVTDSSSCDCDSSYDDDEPIEITSAQAREEILKFQALIEYKIKGDKEAFKALGL